MDLTGTHLYNCSKIIAQYLQLQAIKEDTIYDTLSFPDVLTQNSLDSNEEYVSFHVNLLFTSIALGETIGFFTPVSDDNNLGRNADWKAQVNILWIIFVTFELISD